MRMYPMVDAFRMSWITLSAAAQVLQKRASLADLRPRCLDAPDAITRFAEPFSGDQHSRFPSTEIVLRGTDYFGAFRHHPSLSPTGFLMVSHGAFHYDMGVHLEAFGPSPRSRSSDLRS